MSQLLFILIYGFVILLYSFSSQSKHLISSLIILESLMVISIIYLFFSLGSVNSIGLLLLILTFAAAEAALALSLLISILRVMKNDNMLNLSY
uniref:NADH-ubiquinone oxidoreductase chain 4L n=1 Tax=Gastrocopta cristata TaxID=1128339 RepID=A0A0A6ZAC9_9EUPU|nr:NADH dehydrogenase subunit 4L [Gastrocopta cristata]AGC52854.1 NADH dehydrogenase subunit 4L [Gastrocopta cristata]